MQIYKGKSTNDGRLVHSTPPESKLKLIPPHKNISRLVKAEDLQRVYEDAEEIYKLLNLRRGRHNGYFAIAHPQCIEVDPLRFFVLNNQTETFATWRSVVIINPVIARHTNQEIRKKEGCATFPNLPMTDVVRYHKCEVEYNELHFDKDNKPVLSPRLKANLVGRIAEVFQHETDHLDGKYIYQL